MKRKEGSYLTAGTAGRFVFAALMFAAYFATYSIFSKNPPYADSYREVTKSIAMILSGAMSYVSFTVAELLVFVLLTAALLYLSFAIYKMCATREVLPRLLRMLSNILAFGSAMLLLFFALYGANYFCSPISERMGLQVGEANKSDLIELTEMMRDRANEYADIVPRDMEGFCEFGNFAGMAALVPMGYETLSQEYGFLSSTYAPVKSLSAWKILASFGISGIYVPFTGESIVVPDSPDQSIIFTMAHETAHRLSIAPEDEANFIAFMSCRANTDRRVAYSGYFMAYIYCVNALYAVDADSARAVQAGVNDNLAKDIAQHNESARRYDGVLSKIGDRVNDGYLKSYGQASGTASYGLMVDLLLAAYADVL